MLEERQRLARELHDSVTQSLYSVTLYANAAARHVTVHLHFTAATIRLEVVDDGVGFDLQAVRAEGRGSGGLRSIAERTERLGGQLTYETGPGEGTRLTVEVTL